MTGRSALAVAIVLSLNIHSPLRCDERPNMLFVAVDDLRDWVGCMRR